MTADEFTARRTRRTSSKKRRAENGAQLQSSRGDLPGWITFFFIPKEACEACSRHWHHKCWGVNVLLDPIPYCPCDCGDRKDPARLSPRGWADLALHAPEEVWVAAMFERQRAAGIHVCAMDEKERHRAVRNEELR